MTPAPDTQRRKAILMLLLTTVFWGLSFPVIKSLLALNQALLPGAGPWFVTAQALAPRFVLAAAMMLALRGARPTPREIKQGLGIGVFAAGGMLLQTDGLAHTSASTSAFITQFYAVLIPAWLALRERRNPGAIIWTGCALVMLGTGILGRFDWRTLSFGRGEWETLLSSVFFMAQILWIGRREFTGCRAGAATLVMFAAQAAIFLGLAAAAAPDARAMIAPWRSPAWLGLTLTLAIVCTVGAFWLMNRWQPQIPATQAGLIYCIEPVIASVFALFLPAFLSGQLSIDYPNEHASRTLLVGGGLILIANVLVHAQRDRAAPTATG